MLYSIKNLEELESLKELFSWQNQVNEVQLKDKPGEQYYHQSTEKSILTDDWCN